VKTRYFLKPDGPWDEKEVSEEEYIKAEQNAGFRSTTGGPATGSFHGNGMSGRTEYGSWGRRGWTAEDEKRKDPKEKT